eukprot:TRINITY_DN1993_c0_g3_i1.p1 TRINITY_DN1993_c0_g3~~TRINITY_DN1993_c0_g3_i1.p1  ORF type:complete len:253 (-),score=62.77 TRINITY_DN1993_c0_g3_i1:25-783(-)
MKGINMEQGKESSNEKNTLFFFFKQKTAYEMLRSLVGSEMCIRDSLLAFALRSRYYTAWNFAQAGATLAGVTYNGEEPKTKEHKWDRALTVDATCELDVTIRELAEKWNTSFQRWLRNYSYMRIANETEDKNNRSRQHIAQYITFFLSAIWHGLYPCYFLAFFYWFQLNSFSKKFYKLRKSYPALDNKLVKFIEAVIEKHFLAVGGIIFFQPRLDHLWNFIQNTYGRDIIAIFALTAAFSLLSSGKKKKKHE